MSFIGDILGGQAQDKAYQREAELQRRNATITEQNAEQAYNVYENFDAPRFERTADQLTGTINVATATSGAESNTGSNLRAKLDNSYQLETDKVMMKYNAVTGREGGLNQAIMQRAEADVSIYKGKVAKTTGYIKAAGSLLTSYNNYNKVG